MGATKEAKLTGWVILPDELQPGDVLLTTADEQPRLVTGIQPATWGDDPILVLEINEGCRRPMQVHCLQLPVLVRRAS